MKLRWHLAVAVAALGALVADAETPHRLTTAVGAGQHRRLETDHGVVHVWVPAGYHPDGAATIVYVHGYYTDVDGAWTDHQLPEQFALSALNAVFIACEAPSGAKPKPSWNALDELVGTVFADTGIVRPMGPVIAVGHSGAYRTLEEWLDDPLLDQIVLVDADYDAVEPFEDWLRASPRHRIIDATEDTVVWSEEMARDLADLSPVLVDRLPDDARDWPDGVRTARLVTIRAQWPHMHLVTDGRVLPMLLRLLPVELLADAPWDAPLGDLP